MANHTPLHLAWLVNTGETITTADGKAVEVWEIRFNSDGKVLSDWARHFRNQYCSDAEIDVLRNGTGYSRSEYLLTIKFPDSTNGLGPGVRSGDFGEILIADYLEYVLGYWMPRTRYSDKTVRNQSTQGSDTIGFKFAILGQESPNDALAIFEVKAQFSGTRAKPKLQNAVDDSIKDQIRKAESLNAIKQRLYREGKSTEVLWVARFQNKEDKPYKEISGATALFCSSVYDGAIIASTDTMRHPNRSNLVLLVFRGDNLMALVGELFARAANEA